MGCLDKMKSSVSGVSAQQRYASNIRKINAQIQSNEKEIERLTMQVGIQCVNLHLEEPGTEYENLFAVIRQYQSENRAAGGRRICPSAGSSGKRRSRQACPSAGTGSERGNPPAGSGREGSCADAGSGGNGSPGSSPSEGTGICPSTGIKKTAGNAGPGRC